MYQKWINVRDLTKSEKNFVPEHTPGSIKSKKKSKKGKTQKKVVNTNRYLEDSGIYHNDLIKKIYRSVFDSVPLRTIFHHNN